MNAVLANGGFGGLLVRKFIESFARQPAQRRARSSARAQRCDVRPWLEMLKQGRDVRIDKVATARTAITLDSFDDEHKLDVAVDRLLEDLLSI